MKVTRTFQLDQELDRKLELKAKRRGIKVSELLREIVEKETNNP